MTYDFTSAIAAVHFGGSHPVVDTFWNRSVRDGTCGFFYRCASCGAPVRFNYNPYQMAEDGETNFFVHDLEPEVTPCR